MQLVKNVFLILVLAGISSSVFAEEDEIELEAISIVGNKELPRSLTIVPWKKSDLGDLPGRPVESLLDEALEPVERDVFRRELEYYAIGHSAE